MNLSRHSPSPQRYVGIGMVVALHLAGIYALSAGLIKAPTRVQEPAIFKPLPPEPRTPEPPARTPQAERPTFSPPTVIQVPVPDIVVESPAEPAPITTAPLRSDASPATGGLPRTEAPPTPLAQPRLATAGAVCSVMPRPDVPAVQWSGEAMLHVLATVRGGRVVGSEVRVAQGAMDGKTRRALQRSVEDALAGYRCQGDAVFQQDFAFRLD